MTKPSPSALKDLLQLRRAQADAYAEAHNFDPWATRVAWWALTEGGNFAKKMVSKYGSKSAPAAVCFNNLVRLNVLRGDKIAYSAIPEWENGEGPMAWLDHLIRAAEGTAPPKNFPTFSPST